MNNIVYRRDIRIHHNTGIWNVKLSKLGQFMKRVHTK